MNANLRKFSPLCIDSIQFKRLLRVIVSSIYSALSPISKIWLLGESSPFPDKLKIHIECADFNIEIQYAQWSLLTLYERVICMYYIDIMPCSDSWKLVWGNWIRQMGCIKCDTCFCQIIWWRILIQKLIPHSVTLILLSAFNWNA